MVTISRVHNGKRVRVSGATREDARANLERSIRWLDRFALLNRVTASASKLLKHGVAAVDFRRALGLR